MHEINLECGKDASTKQARIQPAADKSKAPHLREREREKERGRGREWRGKRVRQTGSERGERSRRLIHSKDLVILARPGGSV